MNLRPKCLLLVFFCAFQRLLAGDAPAGPGVHPIQAPGLTNLFVLSPRLYSGAAPEGDAGFASLRALGVKTIISVDGSKPEVDLAARHGLRYIHIPIGYDGASRSNEWRLIRAAQIADGRVYVHCHHGKHRGPAAAAVICEGTEGWGTNQAVAWLGVAGTSPEYPGLYRNALFFTAPTSAELESVPTNFPSRIEVSGLVDTMVGIDSAWDRLKLIQTAGYRVPPAHPDLDPSQEAMSLVEGFREAQRAEVAVRRGDEFLRRLKSAEGAAEELRLVLKQSSGSADLARKGADQAWERVNQTCASCHKDHRNRVLDPR